MSAAAVWTFERFSPGQLLGRVDIPLDSRRIDLWERIYGPVDGEQLPSGLLIAAMMEGYIKAIQPRPQGNVHAAQRAGFTGIRPRLGDRLTIGIECVGKTIRKERFRVDFRTTVSCGDAIALDGMIQTIWAM